MLGLRKFLVDHGHAAIDHVGWRRRFDPLALEPNLSAIRLIGTREDFHQCRLAGAVFSDKAVDFAAPHLEADTLQRLHAGKRLLDFFHLQQIGRRIHALRLPADTVPSRAIFL